MNTNDTIINEAIKDMFNKREELEYKILESILPEEKYDDIYVDGFMMDYLFGMVWIKRNNAIYCGDEFDIKDFVKKGTKKRKLFVFNISFIKYVDNLVYVVEQDGDFHNVYVLDNDLLFDDTYDARQLASHEKFVNYLKEKERETNNG